MKHKITYRCDSEKHLATEVVNGTKTVCQACSKPLEIDVQQLEFKNEPKKAHFLLAIGELGVEK